MPPQGLSTNQQGVIVVNEFAKIVMIGSGGQVELSPPMVDEERRDTETHLKYDFDHSIGWQIKSAIYVQHLWKASVIYIHFDVLTANIVTHPNFWYCFAHLDLEIMALTDPVFLVPSVVFHEVGVKRTDGKTTYFNFEASLDPRSKDKWHAYQHHPRDVGKFVQGLLAQMSERSLAVPAPAALTRIPGLVWARRVPDAR